MGMYDRVDFAIECPNCGHEVTDFQSKDRSCCMATVEVQDVNNWYSNCPVCGLWIEFTRCNKDPFWRKEDD